MSQLTGSSKVFDQQRLEQLAASIRGKLQFMDYLVRAVLSDADRFRDEPDAGTRIFIRQLIEMHANNLGAESESMRLISEFQREIEIALDAPQVALHNGDAA